MTHMLLGVLSTLSVYASRCTTVKLDRSEAGSTLATRRTAAKQIGEIAKARPEDLYALLKKVD